MSAIGVSSPTGSISVVTTEKVVTPTIHECCAEVSAGADKGVLMIRIPGSEGKGSAVITWHLASDQSGVAIPTVANCIQQACVRVGPGEILACLAAAGKV